ncbi:MAG: cyclopropane-fatty-acyl-phospholipid synthase family protein [Candidatus Symbiobacter sp.]|nr:cyclopropane-fatty-acyl-phospholipid synthase family protein [Candidatus Symbiobacter sp.]
MFNQKITTHFLKALNYIDYGSLVLTTPDGKNYAFTGKNPGARAEVMLQDWRVLNAILQRGDIGLAETFRDGGWDTPDLTELFLFGLQNQNALGNYINGGRIGRYAAQILQFFTQNTRRGSKKNISAHYDLGNDFYELWLDPSMTYSSALYSRPGEDLYDAQMHKYDRIIDGLKPSGTLLEIGCGWGGFIARALGQKDYDIKGITISDAQYHFATQRIGQDAVIALEDYREQSRVFDQIVSIEMFEAVGEKYWPVYFAKLKSLLARQGNAIIQTITIQDKSFESYRKSGDAIRTYIFPGGMLPSPTRFHAEAARSGLGIVDHCSFGQSYALTLRQWLKNFDAKREAVLAMGFDEKFIRMWRFYLTYCCAAFSHGQTDVMQWKLSHAD